MKLESHRVGIALGVTILMALLAVPARAQRYHIHTYNEGDGLASSTVWGMVQDLSGRMWFCTRAGITVYDGRDWSDLTPAADGLESADWHLLALDSSGDVWVASLELRVARFDGESWVSLPQPEEVTDCDPRDLAVLGTEKGDRVALGTTCGLMLWDGSNWRHLDVDDGLPDSEVTALEVVDGHLFVATLGGLAVLDGHSTRVSPPEFDVRPGPVTGLAADELVPGGLWVIGDAWLARAEDGRLETVLEGVETGAAMAPKKAVPDGEGGLFFGDLDVFYLYHPERGLQILDSANGMSAGGVNNVYRDREHDVWVSSTRGVSKILSFRFATYLQEHGLYDDEVTAILERRNGSFVLGHLGGLTLMDRAAGGKTRTIEFPDVHRFDRSMGRVLDLAEDAEGTVWIAGAGLGLGKLEGDRVRWLTSFGKPVTSVLFTGGDDGGLWVATGRDVLLGDGKSFERVSQGEGFIYGARRLIEGEDGAVWALTGGKGAHRFREGRWESWAHPSRRDLNNVFAVHERGGLLWFGTAGGLCAAAGGNLEPTSSPMPVITRPVYFLLSDNRGRVWFGTDNGVYRWDGETLDHYTVEDGLGGRETNRAAGVMDSHGHLWIGTTRGLTVYREELDNRLPVPPIVRLQRLEASGEPVPLTEPVRLESSRNDLVFSFSAVSFRDTRDVRIRAWLEGYEKDWSNDRAVADGRLRYTSLSPGRYRLHLKAGSSTGVWSDPIRSREIVIAPPFYGRAWFWIVSLAIAGLMFHALQRYAYQRRYARELEDEVAIRVTELRKTEAELLKAQRLESLGLLAGGIAHDFNNLLMVILGNLSLIERHVEGDDRRWISDAGAAIERARQLTSQLLTFSRGGTPIRSAARIEDVIRESAAFVLSGSSADYEIDLPADLRVVGIDTGQINQVLNNLLLNAAQAMPSGGTIHITGRNVNEIPGVGKPGAYIEIAIRDEGAGIPEQNLERVFDPYFSTKEGGSGLGLTTAYSIARRHGGLLTVESEPGEGSTFRLYLPESEVPKETDVAAAKQSHDLRGARILVMDDNESVREVVVTMLENLGCDVTGTSNGEEALRAYTWARNVNRPFDAVILDLTVPGGMGGEETLQHLLRLDPDVRAIVASGYANAPVMSEYQDLGFQAALQKPFRSDEVEEALRKLVERPTSRALGPT